MSCTSTVINGNLTRWMQWRLKIEERKSPRRAHRDLHRIAVHAGCPRTEHQLIILVQDQGDRQGRIGTWSEFHQKGADDGARTGTDLHGVRKFQSLPTDVLLKHSLRLKPKLNGRCPLVGRVVMVCEQCRMPQSLTKRQTCEPN